MLRPLSSKPFEPLWAIGTFPSRSFSGLYIRWSSLDFSSVWGRGPRLHFNRYSDRAAHHSMLRKVLRLAPDERITNQQLRPAHHMFVHVLPLTVFSMPVAFIRWVRPNYTRFYTWRSSIGKMLGSTASPLISLGLKTSCLGPRLDDFTKIIDQWQSDQLPSSCSEKTPATRRDDVSGPRRPSMDFAQPLSSWCEFLARL